MTPIVHPSTPREATELVIRTLRTALERHHADDVFAITSEYDDVYGALLPIPPSDPETVALAMRFWEDWGEEAIHGWLTSPDVVRDDWPKYAEQIIAALEAGHKITSPVLLEHFGPRVRWRDRLKAWLNKRFGASA